MKLVVVLILSLFSSLSFAEDYLAFCDQHRDEITNQIETDLHYKYVSPLVYRRLLDAFAASGFPITEANITHPLSAPITDGMSYFFAVSYNGVDRHFVANVKDFNFGKNGTVDVQGVDNSVVNPIGQVVQKPTKIVCSGTHYYDNVVRVFNTDTGIEIEPVYLSGTPEFIQFTLTSFVEFPL